MTAIQPYSVPIIAGGLRRAELVKQYADTFDYLETVSQDMLNRIAIRLNVYRAQLNKFDERIQHANAHIDRIKGSNCAIQVHSSARYCVPQNRSTYKSIFECDTDNEDNKPPVLNYNLFHLNGIADKFLDPNDKESKSNDETLVVLKQYENNFIQKTKRKLLTGLGKPSANIKSAVSFLKYNAQENPYTQSTNIDPLSVGGRIRKQVDEPAQPRIFETEVPAFYKQVFGRSTICDIGYKPVLDLVPEFTLPHNLPELGSFATFNDTTVYDWTEQQMTSIAPSYANAMLPDINDLPFTTTPAPPVELPKSTVPDPSPVDITPIIRFDSAPPLPPPAPSLPLPDNPVPIPPSSIDESKSSVDNKPVIESGGGGNSLLHEILNFPIHNLRQIRQSDRRDQAPLTTSLREESTMNALSIHLERRRAFIAPAAAEEPYESDDSDDDYE